METGSKTFDCHTLQGNWYEERFFDADTRQIKGNDRIRPRTDEIENIPRIRRQNKPDADVFAPDKDEEDRFVTDNMRTYVRHRVHEESVTERRMAASGEHLAEILAAEPNRYIPNYSTKPISPEEQFQTTTGTAYKGYF